MFIKKKYIPQEASQFAYLFHNIYYYTIIFCYFCKLSRETFNYVPCAIKTVCTADTSK